jgi:hypothetical protein
MYLREPNNGYRYGHFIAFTDPTIYIRKPAGVQIFSGSITVKKIGGAAISSFTVQEYETPYTSGQQIIAITVPTKIGMYFGEDMTREPGIEVSFDFRPNISVMDQINWHDYIVADTPQYHAYGAINGALEQIKDIYDANQNNNTGENMMRMNTAATQVISSNVLLMDTYLIPDGGTRQPSYDPSQPQTAVAFTP